MADLVALLQQIADATRVILRTTELSPGEPLQLEVLSGVLPPLPAVSDFSNLSPIVKQVTGALDNVHFDNANLGPTALAGNIVGKINFGALSGSISGVVNTLIEHVKVDVAYEITPHHSAVRYPLADTDPFRFLFFFKPPIVDSMSRAEPRAHFIKITVTVTAPALGQVSATREFNIPIHVLPLKIPALLMISRYDSFQMLSGDDPGAVLVMVRAGSELRDFGQLASSLNGIAQIIYRLGFAGIVIPLAFADALDEVVQAIRAMPYTYLSAGNMPDFEDFGFPGHVGGDLDGDARAAFLIGVTGTTAILYEGSGYTNDNLTMSVDEITVGNLPTGLGYQYLDHFTNWGNSGNKVDAEISSCRFAEDYAFAL